MSFIDHAAREINFKIVYYGPGLGGKTTNLQYIYNKTRPELKSRMISLATETERSLFCSILASSLEVRGLKVRLHLYTVPGPVFYDISRQTICKGADGVVFVVDSQAERAVAGVESLEGLESNLAVYGLALAGMPFVFQYNKRDLPNALPVAELDELLGFPGVPRFEAVAAAGVGVFDTLKEVAKRMLVALQGSA